MAHALLSDGFNSLKRIGRVINVDQNNLSFSEEKELKRNNVYFYYCFFRTSKQTVSRFLAKKRKWKFNRTKAKSLCFKKRWQFNKRNRLVIPTILNKSSQFTLKEYCVSKLIFCINCALSKNLLSLSLKVSISFYREPLVEKKLLTYFVKFSDLDLEILLQVFLKNWICPLTNQEKKNRNRKWWIRQPQWLLQQQQDMRWDIVVVVVLLLLLLLCCMGCCFYKNVDLRVTIFCCCCSWCSC